MDLLELRLNTIFKLNLLGLEQQELDRLCDSVMRGNTKAVRGIVYKYIRNSTSKRSDDYFVEFTKKKNNKYVKKMSLDQVKGMIAMELNRCLKHEFRGNLSNLKFQKIVLKAIDYTSKSPLENVKENIPQWIKQEYAHVELKNDEEVVSDPEAIFNMKLLNEKKSIANVVQDVYELVDHLEYVNNLKKQIIEMESTPGLVAPTGMVDAFEYAEYLRQSRVQVGQLREELAQQKQRTRDFLKISAVPDEIKRTVVKNNFEVKDNQYKLFILRIRKKFENFILNEKYGSHSERVWNAETGQMMNRAVMCFDYEQENDCVKLDSLLLNSVKCNKKKFNSLMKRMNKNPKVNVVKTGSVGDNYYIVYDYLAPKKWFRNEDFFQKVESKLEEPKFKLDEEIEASYCFPYESHWQIQQRFAYNMNVFLNKNKIKGLSDRSEEGMKVPVNSFQIYYPKKGRVSKRNIIVGEQKMREFKKVYGSFHHKLNYTTKGELLSGGNIVKECYYSSGDIDLDFYIADIDARTFKFETWIRSGVMEDKRKVYESFYKDMATFYAESHASHHLRKFVRNVVAQHLNYVKVIVDKKQEIAELQEKTVGLHGNSREKKQLDKKIALLTKRLPKQEVMDGIKKKLDELRKINKELREGVFGLELREMVFERLDNYAEVRYYRRVHIHRDVLSYTKTMINNLNIVGVARTYDSKKSGVFHKYSYKYEELKFENLKLSDLFSCLLRVTIGMKDNELFDELFRFLYDNELEIKEQLLLTDFKGY